MDCNWAPGGVHEEGPSGCHGWDLDPCVALQMVVVVGGAAVVEEKEEKQEEEPRAGTRAHDQDQDRDQDQDQGGGRFITASG